MILVVGEALVDLVIDPAGNVTAALGGAPFNTARACGRLGADVAFLGAISVDRFGSMLAAQLEADGVSTSYLPRCEAPTTLAAAELDDRGTATYRFYFEGDVGALARCGDRRAVAVGRVHRRVGAGVGADGRDCRGDGRHRCRRRRRGDGRRELPARIIPARAPYVERVERVLRRADVVKVSDEDLAYLHPDLAPLDAARAVLGLGPKAVLLTAGGGSVHVLTAAGATEVPVPKVDVVDTIGAGDSFGGGFLSWWQASGGPASDLASLDRAVPRSRRRSPSPASSSRAEAPIRPGVTSSLRIGRDRGSATPGDRSPVDSTSPRRASSSTTRCSSTCASTVTTTSSTAPC